MSNPNVDDIVDYSHYRSNQIVVSSLKRNHVTNRRYLCFRFGFNPNYCNSNFTLPTYVVGSQVAKTNISFRDTETGKFISYKTICEEHNLDAMLAQIESLPNFPNPSWYQ